MRDGWLSDGDVAALARQAVDLLGQDIAIDIEPPDPSDPYRFGAGMWLVFPLVDGHRAFGIGVDAGLTPAQALASLIDAISENSGETARLWGRAFPSCPGHQHPAEVTASGDEVLLRCPETGAEVARIAPAVDEAPAGP